MARLAAPAILGLLASCSGALEFGGANKSATPAPAPQPAPAPDGGGTDAPIWVNSHYLTCNWSAIESKTDAAIDCSVKSAEGATVSATPDVKITWVLLDEKKNAVPTEDSSPAATLLQSDVIRRYVLPARDLAQRTLRVTLELGANVSTFERDLKELPGLNDGTLSACFATDSWIASCFAAAGLNVPVKPGAEAPPPPPEPACVVKLSQAEIRKGRGDQLTVEITPAAGFDVSEVEAMKLDETNVPAGTITDRKETSFVFVPDTANAAANTALTFRGRITSKAGKSASCEAQSTVVLYDLQQSGTPEILTPPSVSARGRTRLTYMLKHLIDGESMTSAAFTTLSVDFLNPVFTSGAVTCAGTICEQPVTLEIDFKLLPETTRYEGQMIQASLTSPSLPLTINFTHSITVNVGAVTTPSYTATGTAGHPNAQPP